MFFIDPIPFDVIKNLAGELNLGAVGVMPSTPLPWLREFLEERVAEGLVVPFASGEPYQRSTPRANFPWAESLIVLAQPLLEVPAAARARHGPMGMAAAFAVAHDYHRSARIGMESLARALQRHLSTSFSWNVVVDGHPLVERALGWRAGLGWYGKNCLLISPQYGSRFTLGVLAMDLPAEESFFSLEKCGGCQLCVENCPTGALEAPYTINPWRCISYLTQSRLTVPVNLRVLMGNRVFGCDCCQDICPRNRPHGQREGSLIPLHYLLHLDRREFQASFGQTAMAWRGPALLRRNAAIALGNVGDSESVDHLAGALLDPVQGVRLHAAWALSRLGGRKAREALYAAAGREEDEEVNREIRLALQAV